MYVCMYEYLYEFMYKQFMDINVYANEMTDLFDLNRVYNVCIYEYIYAHMYVWVFVWINVWTIHEYKCICKRILYL